MANSSNWIISLKALLIAAGVVSVAMATKYSVPLMINFAIYEVPMLWSIALSWLKPPYLYIVINGIIITIAASSRFHQKQLDVSNESEPLLSSSPPPSNLRSDLASVVAPVEFGAVEEPTTMYESKVVLPEVKDLVMDGYDVREQDEDEFVISRSTWTPPQKIKLPEIKSPENRYSVIEKPLVSSRFGHRKPVKSSPEGGVRALGVTKPKRQETLENTWKTITDGRHMPLNRHLKKCETLDNHMSRQMSNSSPQDQPPPHMVTKSETFKDRTNFYNQQHPSESPSAKLRKEASLSQDELNRRVEAFIKKFNDEMRLQRQESLNQYMEMINRGAH